MIIVKAHLMNISVETDSYHFFRLLKIIHNPMHN